MVLTLNISLNGILLRHVACSVYWKTGSFKTHTYLSLSSERIRLLGTKLLHTLLHLQGLVTKTSRYFFKWSAGPIFPSCISIITFLDLNYSFIFIPVIFTCLALGSAFHPREVTSILNSALHKINYYSPEYITCKCKKHVVTLDYNKLTDYERQMEKYIYIQKHTFLLLSLNCKCREFMSTTSFSF